MTRWPTLVEIRRMESPAFDPTYYVGIEDDTFSYGPINKPSARRFAAWLRTTNPGCRVYIERIQYDDEDE